MHGYGIGPHLAAGAPALVPQTVGGSLRVVVEIADNPNECKCHDHHGEDPELDRLRDLVTSGMGQWEACRIVWPADEDTEEVA